MIEHWQSFLESYGASLNPDGEIAFPAAAHEAGCVLCDLSHLGLIGVSGADAKSFLQGQTTNDTSKVDPAKGQINSICSPKGRMLASFLLFQSSRDSLMLQLPAARIDAILKRLRMFVLRSRVTLDDFSHRYVRFGVAGEAAEQALSSALGTPPDQEFAVVHHDSVILLRLPGPQPRFEALGDPTRMQALWSALAEQATPVSSNHWALLDIRAGMPTVYERTVETFVPQMANLQLLGGVSFSKGCYTGQEIVARMQYLGRLKRRMYRARVDVERCPQPGDPLFSPSSESGQGDGTIVDARPTPQGGCELLAVIPIGSVDADDVHLGDARGPKLVFLDLPYGFTEDGPSTSH